MDEIRKLCEHQWINDANYNLVCTKCLKRVKCECMMDGDMCKIHLSMRNQDEIRKLCEEVLPHVNDVLPPLLNGQNISCAEYTVEFCREQLTKALESGTLVRPMTEELLQGVKLFLKTQSLSLNGRINITNNLKPRRAWKKMSG